MNSEHCKEQEEAHRRDFEIYWRDIVVPVALEMGFSKERIEWLKENDWKAWLTDDALDRLLESNPPPD